MDRKLLLLVVESFLMSTVYQYPSPYLRTPPDSTLAHRLFGANCGPNALAALLAIDVIDVMCHFTHFPEVQHTNIPKMREVLERASIVYQAGSDVPSSGLVLIELLGPWSVHPAARKWTSTMTHWIASREGYVFDINAGGWISWEDWRMREAPRLVERGRGATGWRIKRSYSIDHRVVDVRSAFPGLAFGWSAR